MATMGGADHCYRALYKTDTEVYVTLYETIRIPHIESMHYSLVVAICRYPSDTECKGV